MLIELGQDAPGVDKISKTKLCRDKIAMVSVQPSVPDKSVVESPMFALFSSDITELSCARGTTSVPGASKPPAETPHVAYRIEFYADATLQSKMETIRTMLSSTYPQGATMAQMIDILTDSYLKKEKKIPLL